MRMEPRTYDREAEYQSLRALMRSSEAPGGTARLLRTALREELTARQAQMVRMYYLEQRTMRDIARALGVNPSTVSRTLAAARVRLKRCLRYMSRVFLREEGA